MSGDLLCVADVAVEPVRWLWPGRIPLGKITALDGDPGVGKSTLTLTLAAKVTTGSPFSDQARPEIGDVILLSAEDEIGDTIRPRLEAAGADLGRCWVLPDIRPEGEPPRPPELPLDLDQLEGYAKDRRAALVIIDPLMAFLSGQVDAHRDQDVRRALAAMAAMAARTGAAVVIVRHMNKSAAGSPLYRGGGSIGIIGAARAGLLVAPDPDDETDTRRVLAVSKSNLAAKPPSLAYRIVGDDLYDTARVVWEGATSHTAEGLLGHPVDRPSPEQDRAETFLAEQLAGGPRPAEDLRDLAEARGLAWRTVQRASDSLEVEVERRPAPGKRGRGPSWWSLPNKRPGIRAAANTAPDGAYSSGEKPQVSEPEASPNGIRAAAPSVLNLGAQSPVGRSVWRCDGCGVERTTDLTGFRHADCGGHFQPTEVEP
jgi:AAA domain